MSRSPLGRTLVIANPAAHSGDGLEGAHFAARFFASYESATDGFEVVATKGPGEAQEIAADLSTERWKTVVALGGDGVIHEVVDGLMAVPRDERPQLAVIPMGSGNDYARTLGMSRNDAEAACAQLVRGVARPVEVGCVNGQYFMQTLSFGLDAAIALDTTRKRAEGTSQKGEALFINSAIRIFAKAGAGYACRASFDGADPLDLKTIIFAVQVGPTYGGGFAICPEATPEDGLLDVCYNVRRPSTPTLLGLLGLARFGKHTGSSVVDLRRVGRAVLDFEEQPPCQIDGEPLPATHYEIEVVPNALDVVFPTA